MGAIAGFWHLDGRPADPSALAAMGARLAHRAPDGVHTTIEGPVGMLSALSRTTPESHDEVQPVRHPSGSILVWDGRLDNREDLLPHLSGRSQDDPDSLLVAEGAARFGDRVAERLAGDFAFASFDPQANELLLVRDQIGMRALFVYRRAGLIVFATEVKAILAHPDVQAAPDLDELATFVFNGTPRGADAKTLFADVERVMPSHVVRVRPGGSSTRMYWDFDKRAKIRLGSFEEYAEAFAHHLETSVRRRMRSAHPVGISLSGGLDSTTIMCLGHELHREDPDRFPPLVPVTFSTADGSLADEWRYLQAIEQELGVSVMAVPPATVKPSATVDDVVWMAEVPGTETFWDAMHDVHGMVAAAGARVFVSGHLGDQFLFDRAYLVDLFDRLRWGRILHDIREYPKWNLEGDMSPLQQEFYRHLLRDHLPARALPLARKLKAQRAVPLWDRPWYTQAFRERGSRPVATTPRVRFQFASAHAHSIYMQVRGPSAVQSMEGCDRAWAAGNLELSWPYADRDLISFLMAIPGEMQQHDGVPRAILREAMRGRIPEAIRTRRWKGSFGKLIDQAIDEDHDDLLAAAQGFSATVEMGLVDPESLSAAIQEPDEWVYAGLNNTLALEAWLRRFF